MSLRDLRRRRIVVASRNAVANAVADALTRSCEARTKSIPAALGAGSPERRLLGGGCSGCLLYFSVQALEGYLHQSTFPRRSTKWLLQPLFRQTDGASVGSPNGPLNAHRGREFGDIAS